LSVPYKLFEKLNKLSCSARWIYLQLLCNVVFKYNTRRPKNGSDIVCGTYKKEYGVSKQTYFTVLRELILKEFIVCIDPGAFGKNRKPGKYQLLVF